MTSKGSGSAKTSTINFDSRNLREEGSEFIITQIYSGFLMNFSELLGKYSSSENRSLENWNPNRVRHNVYSPEGKDALLLFDKAVGLMKERSLKNPADLLGWNYQAGIHGIWNLDYEKPDSLQTQTRAQLADFAEEKGFDTRENVLNGNTVLNNCTHFTAMWNGTNLTPGTTAKVNNPDASPANFIAWHRLYLQYFEEIARENLRLSGEANTETWALPYWAYLNEEDVLMPDIFRDTGSNLYTPYRNPQLNAGTALTQLTNYSGAAANWPKQTLQGLNKNNYMAMGTLIENMPHNQFHVASGTDGGLFGDEGLMLLTSSAAFDPIFWVHHSFIDKLWSAYNASENANYAFKYDFDQNPWNYMFLKPSPDGSLEKAKDKISYWGNNSINVISKIYNPDYSYDYLGTTTNPTGIPGPNKVLSIIQAPAYRPTISETKWSEPLKPIFGSTNLYSSIIPLTINSRAFTAKAYLDLTDSKKNNGNPFDLVSAVELLLPNPPAKATFLLTRASLTASLSMETRLIQAMAGPRATVGLSVQGLSMGVDECHQKNPTSHSHCNHMPMLMPTTAIIDFGYSVIQPDGTDGEYGYSYVPSDDSKPDDQIVLLMLTNSADTRVSSVTTSLNQNFNKNSSNYSTFDATAYFARFPGLLTNPEATANPEAYFEKYDKGKGIVAPELNFRAAATGMAYLMDNKKLLEVGISSSPYAAISNYLDNGQMQGLSLGDSSLIKAKNYFRSNDNSGGIILDFSALRIEEKITADIIIGRDASYKPTVGFYHVKDDLGTITIDGIDYKPSHRDYASLAISSKNLFDELTGLNANLGVAEYRQASEFDRKTGKLAPFALVNDNIFFSFADANIDNINHFYIHGANIIGLEDMLHGGDTDFDDTLLGFKFEPRVVPVV